MLAKFCFSEVFQYFPSFLVSNRRVSMQNFFGITRCFYSLNWRAELGFVGASSESDSRRHTKDQSDACSGPDGTRSGLEPFLAWSVAGATEGGAAGPHECMSGQHCITSNLAVLCKKHPCFVHYIPDMKTISSMHYIISKWQNVFLVGGGQS